MRVELRSLRGERVAASREEVAAIVAALTLCEAVAARAPAPARVPASRWHRAARCFEGYDVARAQPG